MQDEEDELLAQALDLSLEQQQRQTGRPVSRPRRPAGCTRTRDHFVPQSLAGMSEEQAPAPHADSKFYQQALYTVAC